MKAKLILFTYLCTFLSIGIFAQNITLNPRVVSLQGELTESMDAITSLTNNTIADGDSMFNWTLIEKDLPVGWDYNFCDVNDCYLSSTTSSPIPFRLKKGATTNTIKSTIFYNGKSGKGTLRFAFSSVTNPMLKDTFTVTLQIWNVGLSKVKRNASEVSFFPNPAKDNITFKYPSSKNVEVNIYNVLGSKVKSFNHQGAETMVNISDLQKGIYFIRFNDHGAVISKSFTKSE